MFDISIVFNISAVIPSHPALLLFFKIYIFLHISFTLNGYFVCVGLMFLTSKHPLLNCFLKYICMSFYCSLQFAIKPPYLFLQEKVILIFVDVYIRLLETIWSNYFWFYFA